MGAGANGACGDNSRGGCQDKAGGCSKNVGVVQWLPLKVRNKIFKGSEPLNRRKNPWQKLKENEKFREGCMLSSHMTPRGAICGRSRKYQHRLGI